MQHIITNSRGKPLRGLTELIQRAAKLAGLPRRCVAHGLRKAALRRLAEHGSTTKEIAAVSGHRSLSEIERYTARADQAGLAQAAIAKLPDGQDERVGLTNSGQVSKFPARRSLISLNFLRGAF